MTTLPAGKLEIKGCDTACVAACHNIALAAPTAQFALNTVNGGIPLKPADLSAAHQNGRA